MKRLLFLILAGCIAIVCLLSLVIGLARTARTGERRSAFLQNDIRQEAVQPAAPAQPIIPGLFIAPDLPVTLTAGAVGSERGFPEIQCVINAKAALRVSQLHFALFQLNQARKLVALESSNRAFDLTTSRSGNLTLRLRRPIATGTLPVLALESVSGPDSAWLIDFHELTRTVIARASGDPTATVTVLQSQDRQRADYGSNFCARAFALSLNAVRYNGGANPPVFNCDQNSRAYSFAFLEAGTPAPR